MEGTQFRYVIKFVADMNRAVKFYRDTLGLQLKFESPGWSEFVTGETTLALHPASEKSPAGKDRIGVHSRRRRGFLPGHERQRSPVQHAAQEAGLRRGAGAVRRFRRRTLQRRCRGGVSSNAANRGVHRSFLVRHVRRVLVSHAQADFFGAQF